MPALTYKEIIKKLKSGDALGGVYFFFGEEDYTKYDAIKRLKVAASESGFPEFNTIRLTSTEYSFEALSEAIESPPLMSDLKFVEITDADVLGAKVKELDATASLLSSVPEDIAVAFVFSSDDINEKVVTASALYKGIAKAKKVNITLINCAKATPSEIVNWIFHRLDALSVKADSDTAAFLAKRCGYSMFTLVGEITKLAAYAEANGKDTINCNDVKAVVSETVDVGAFELTNAISERRISDALAIYAKMKRLGEDPRLILGSVTANFSVLCTLQVAKDAGLPYSAAASEYGINEYRAKLMYKSLQNSSPEYMRRALKLFSNTDRLSKSSDTDLYTQIELLISSLK